MSLPRARSARATQIRSLLSGREFLRKTPREHEWWIMEPRGRLLPRLEQRSPFLPAASEYDRGERRASQVLELLGGRALGTRPRSRLLQSSMDPKLRR